MKPAEAYPSKVDDLQRYPAGDARYDGISALSGMLVIAGAYLLGWAVTHGVADDPFTSAWAGLLYAAFVLAAGLVLVSAWRNHNRGYPWRDALPRGYAGALLGVGCFALGVIGQGVWATLLGAAGGIAQLTAPPVLVMILGVALIVTGPLYAARARYAPGSTLPTRALAVPLLSALSLLSILTFATQFLHPLVEPLAAQDASTPAIPRDLYMMNSDGTAQTRVVTDGDQKACCAAWSRDGRTLVFTAIGSVAELHVVNADGSGKRQLTHTGRINYLPAWSPDGTRIAFISQAGQDVNTAEVYVIEADGTGQRQLTSDAAWDYGASWSPDGSRIAYGSLADGTWKVYLMNADGSGKAPLSESFGGNAPAWSPDGRSILFTSDRTGNDSIYVMDADGTHVRRLTFDEHHSDNAVWSPDGGKIAFSTNRMGNNEIYVMNADGTGMANLTRNRVLSHNFPSWSPDGRTILYSGEAQQSNTADLRQALGVASIMIQSTLLIGVVLPLVLTWRLPFGTLTLLLTANALLMGTVNDQYALVLAGAGGGLIADLLQKYLRPSQARVRRTTAFAFFVPVVFFSLYYLTLAIAHGIAWSIHVWSGSIVLAGLMGLFLTWVLSALRGATGHVSEP